MKITIIGAAGVRTPLIVRAIQQHQDRLGLEELSLMDIDEEHLEFIGALISPIENSPNPKFHITRTTEPQKALEGADFVITTFRVGGIGSRAIDERVPLMHGILGQETTGAGGFAMGIRSIPVILNYVKLMQKECPQAWLINFANPAGMLTESVIRNTSWRRVVGICDTPSSMHRTIARVLQVDPDEIYLDYFGLNHLGWIKRIIFRNQDQLPKIFDYIINEAGLPGIPFDPDLISSLGLIPNEYLYYYYYSAQAVNNILQAGETRGEQIAKLSLKLFDELKVRSMDHDIDGMLAIYQSYLEDRSSTYMVMETGKVHDFSQLNQATSNPMIDEGYAGVALNLIDALIGNNVRTQIFNVPNQGSINGMDQQDVVEIPCLVSYDHIQPLAVGEIPAHCMGLIKQVKHYEHLTIEAVVEGSYPKARLALSIHPLVRDYGFAGTILDEYIFRHQGIFPEFK